MLLLLSSCALLPQERQLLVEDRGPLPPTVVVVSLDGFRQSYFEDHPTPHLDAIAARGARSEGLIPPYPSLTFPSHYTAATGLYPQNHGLVGNTFYDPERDESYAMSDSSTVRDGSWYGGEPIWATANKAGLRTATLYWVGSEAEIAGERPDEWYAYGDYLSFEERVDKVLSWLAREGDTRPQLITLYMNEPDHTGHEHGPDELHIPAAVAEVDEILGLLTEGIEELGQSDSVNLIVSSDHGMTQLSRERVVFLDDAIDLEWNSVYAWGAAAHFWPEYDREPDVEALLADLATLEHIECARKEDLDPELHFSHNARIPSVICLAEDGWSITSRPWFESHPDDATGGTHGYDPRFPSMHGLFVAAGPGFRQAQVPAFENVHLYELMCHLLEIEPADNDGDLALLEALLAED